MTLTAIASHRRALVAWLMGFALAGAHAAQPPASAAPAASQPAVAPAAAASAAQDEDAPTHSMMDAAMFYELLIADISMNEGDYATAYQILSRDAVRARDERLYAQALSAALLAHSGSDALAAGRAWTQAFPHSQRANENMANLAIVMGRADLVPPPLRALIDDTPAAQRDALIRALPRLMLRMSDKQAAAQTLEQTLEPYARDGLPTQNAAQLATAQLWGVAQKPQRALALLRAVQARDPANEQVALIAIDLIGQDATAEDLVTRQLSAAPASSLVRIKYANALSKMQRLNEAKEQLDIVLAHEPDLSLAWLMKGQLCHDLRQYAISDDALKHYLQLSAKESEEAGDDAAEVDSTINTAATHNAVYLLLAESAQMQGHLQQALQWLDKLPDDADDSAVLERRASVLMALGHKDEAAQAMAELPADTTEQARDKLRVQVQVLMDNKQWTAAYDLLTRANQQFPDNTSLLYDQALLAEHLDRLDDMERLLKRVIALKPDYQPAYNALGYSLADHNERLDEARRYVQKALDLAPGDPLVTDSMGWVEYRSGHLDEALRLVRQAYAKRAEPEIAAHLVEILWRLNRKDEALAIARQTQRLTPDNEDVLATLKRLGISL
jgi:tetratricopeptide (TPR) repeat protein